MDLGLSYDDVLLVPQRSSLRSRKDVSLASFLTKNIKLNIPIISSNMDTVTESSMAIAIAQLGGIGIIHRFNTVEQQVQEVRRVKRYMNAIIENPLTISHTKTIGEAKELMAAHGVTGVLVVKNKKLVGILTARDYRFNPPDDTRILDLMTPKDKLIVGGIGISAQKAKYVLLKHKIEKLPLINEDWTVAGLITGKDIHMRTKYPNSALDAKQRLLVGAAIGVKEDSFARAKALIDAGCDVLVIDVAHGHSDMVIETLKLIKKKFNIDVIAGNVATAEGAKELVKAGADAIKVGVGPGSICITRVVTGAGYPQLSAVQNAVKVTGKIPIIADGGIKQSGDITKALAAGASTVMLGRMLAGTDESPGMPLIRNGKKFKVIRGMASYGAKLGRDNNNRTDQDIGDYVPEGVEAVVEYKGSVKEIVFQLTGGLRSGMSYAGARNIDELHQNAKFVRITTAGLKESHAHDVNLV